MSQAPLSGRRVLVTRTRERAGGLVDLLHRLGAVVTVVPMITTVPLATPDAVRESARRAAGGQGRRWAAFSSAAAVRLVTGALDLDALHAFEVAVVGPETAAAVRAAGLRVDLEPARHDADGLADALVERGMAGATVWLPLAAGARDVLARRLGVAGAAVQELRLYRSEMPSDAPTRLRRALDGGVDAVTLTSGSTARHLVQALDGATLPEAVVVACIGAQTAAEATRVGLSVTCVAGEQSAAGIAAALARHFTALG